MFTALVLWEQAMEKLEVLNNDHGHQPYYSGSTDGMNRANEPITLQGGAGGLGSCHSTKNDNGWRESCF